MGSGMNDSFVRSMKRMTALFLLLLVVPVAAQTTVWSLNDCMGYAVQNSIKARKQYYMNDNLRQDRIQATAAMLPSLGASTQAGWGFGRTINPENNTYKEMTNFNNTYSLSASLPLFNGFAALNTLRASKIAELRGVQEAQRVADEIALETMQAYYDVVYCRGAVDLARQQREASRFNRTKTAKMVELGIKAPADLLQMEAQESEDDYRVTYEQNQLERAMLRLKDCMNFPLSDSLDIDEETGNDLFLKSVEVPADSIYEYARAFLPQSLVAGYALRESELDFKATRGRQLPSFSASGGYFTNYFRNISGDNSGGTPGFRQQFHDHLGKSVGVTMSIPLFNGLQRRTEINRCRNALFIARQQVAETERQLQNEIAQAVLDVEGLSKEYRQALKRSEAYDEAHRANLRRFEQGTLTVLDLQNSGNLLLLSRSQELQIRLNYRIRSRLLEFYQGRPLIDP